MDRAMAAVKRASAPVKPMVPVDRAVAVDRPVAVAVDRPVAVAVDRPVAVAAKRGSAWRRWTGR